MNRGTDNNSATGARTTNKKIKKNENENAKQKKYEVP